MKRLIIIGASGHGKVVADVAKKCGYNDIVFLDNDRSIAGCMGFPVVGTDSMVPDLEGDVFIAVGNADARKRLMEKYSHRHFPTLVHPYAVVAESAVIGAGSVVMAGVVINPDAKIGEGCIINTSSSIDHDCEIGNYVHVSVGAHLSGSVKVDDLVWIGAGATISNNICICSGAVLGAGAVVVKDIKESGTYIGVPAKKMERKAQAN